MLQVIATLIALSSMKSPGWHKIQSENTFDSVAVTREQHDEIVERMDSADFWGSTGPQSVFRSWNSSAYDPEENVMYFHGGGHANYGGNEVYAYNINTLTWSRLTDPAPLVMPETHSKNENKTVFLPNDGPISAHTYDAFVWNPATKSIWTSSTIGFGDSKGAPPHAPNEKAIWEFIPSQKKWVKHLSSNDFPYPMALYLKQTQQILIVGFQGKSHNATLFDKDGTEHYLGKIEGLDASGISSLFRNPETGDIYSTHFQGIYKINLDQFGISAQKATSYPTLDMLNYTTDWRHASFNYRPIDGKFYIWNGGGQMVTWSPETNEFKVIWSDGQQEVPSHAAKGAEKVFDKFLYLEEHDLFFGLTNGGQAQESDGMWAWRPSDLPKKSYKLAEFGKIELDGATQTSASFFLPIISGDRNYNANAKVDYKVKGQVNWSEGTELLRIRPEFTKNSKNDTGISAEGFAGIITGLLPATQYEFRVSMIDEDQNNNVITQQISATTYSVKAEFSGSNIIEVNNTDSFKTALSNAQPGDTIKLLPGTYKGTFTIAQSGTANSPITITGTDSKTTIIDATNESVGIKIKAENIVVSNLHISHAKTGIRFLDNRNTNITITKNHISDVKVGIDAKGGHNQLYINNNSLEGRAAFADVSRDTWNSEGIVVTGQNIEISHNTLLGFGDSIGMSWQTSLANLSINIHHNLILWGGDDGIEFDFSLRNVSAHHNLISNTANGLSFQPVFGGPAIAHSNIVLNTGRGPVKIKAEKDDPSGILIYNNTFIKDNSNITSGGDEAWKNTGGNVKQLFVHNNLFVSPTDASNYVLNNASSHDLTQVDYNGWTAEGRYSFKLNSITNGVRAASFSEWQANGIVGMHDSLLELDKVFSTYDPDFDNKQFSDYRSPIESNFQLNPLSTAVDAGKPIYGFTSKYKGIAPDLGALETGELQPVYGAYLMPAQNVTTTLIDDVFSMPKNTQETFSPLSNDIAPLGTSLTLLSVDNSDKGTVTLTQNNQIEFTPTKDFVGQVTLIYQVKDNNGKVFSGTIYIVVNQINRPPSAANDVVSIKIGESTTISFAKLLANDSDPDGDTISITDIGQTSFGKLTVKTNNVLYQPNTGFVGTDAVLYQITDSEGLSSQGKLIIKVLKSNAIFGTKYRDNINVSDSSEGITIIGNGGSDIIVGTNGNDLIIGGIGEDYLTGGAGNDIFEYSNEDNKSDWVDGGSGYNQIIGTDSDNIISLHDVINIAVIDGKAGVDMILGGNYAQYFDFSATTLTSIELIDGGKGYDHIIGSQGADNIKGSEKDDYLDGQDGIDTAFYDGSANDYTIEIVDNTTYVNSLNSDEGSDVLVNIEHLQFLDKRVDL